jgi:hypothetical protein
MPRVDGETSVKESTSETSKDFSDAESDDHGKQHHDELEERHPLLLPPPNGSGFSCARQR